MQAQDIFMFYGVNGTTDAEAYLFVGPLSQPRHAYTQTILAQTFHLVNFKPILKVVRRGVN